MLLWGSNKAEHHDRKNMVEWEMREGKEGEEKALAMFPALPKSMHALFFLPLPTMAYILNLLPPPDNVLTWDHTLHVITWYHLKS